MSTTSDKIYDAVGDSYKVRRSLNAENEGIQHLRIDIGTGTEEKQLSEANPLPTTVEGNVSIANELGEQIGGATPLKVAIENVVVTGSSSVPLQQNEGTNELRTYDTNLENLLGTSSLKNLDGRIKTSQPEDLTLNPKQLIGTNAVYQVAIPLGYATLTLQLSGTWAGTQTFEATANGGDWVGILGTSPTAIASYATTTTGGIYQFNVVGLKGFRVRFSTATSGVAIAQAFLSATLTVINCGTDMYADRVGYFSQRASTYELNTYDTTLPTTVNPAAARATIVPVAPTLPSAYAANMFARTPQIYARLMTEAAGSLRLPFAQEQNTNRMLVSTPEVINLLEQILLQLMILNEIDLGAPGPNSSSELI